MITKFKIFERAINRKMKPIGDFLYDTFFKSHGGYVQIEEGLSKDKKYYGVSILFNYNVLSAEKQKIEEFKKFIKPYCFINYTETYYRPKMAFRRNGVRITIEKDSFSAFNKLVVQLGIKPEKVEEIKNLPEFQEWYNNIKDKYEEFQIRKDMRKYNL
jgi:hypothetical protein